MKPKFMLIGWPEKKYYFLCKKHDDRTKGCFECDEDRERIIDICVAGMGMTP